MTAYEEWTSPGFVTDVTVWLDATLARTGRIRTGPVEQPRTRPWGTVLRAPTSAGPVWLKCPAPSLRFELPLLTALGGAGPDGVPEVLATDAARGLLLLADAGRPLTACVPDRAARAARFAAAWPVVGAVQRASVPLVPTLLEAGVADLRPDVLPARFDAVIERARTDHGDDPDDRALFHRLAGLRSRYVEVCAELAASGIPAAVDHNDVHDGNVLLDAAGRVSVVDWGDAVVAHPFAMLVTAEQVLTTLLADGTSTLQVVAAARDGYLAGFAGTAPGEDLARTAWLARTAAEIGRTWVWQRAGDAFADAPGITPPPGWPPDFRRGALRPLTRLASTLATRGAGAGETGQ